MPDEAHAPMVVSRPLLLGWCLWLLASWVANLVAYSPQRSWVMEIDGLEHWRVPAESFIPIARSMMVSIAISIGMVWPAWRLSLSGPERAARTVSDGISLWLVAQVVVWPLRVLVELSLTDLALISATLGAVTALASVCITVGRRGGGPWRAAAMLTCAAALLGHWLLAYAGSGTALTRLSPLSTLWSLSVGGSHPSAAWKSLAVVAILIVMLALVGILQKAKRTGPHPAP